MKTYTVEVENNGCERCGHGKLWVVVDPDGIAGGTSYSNEEEAADIAGMLNDALKRGQRRAKSLADSVAVLIADNTVEGWFGIGDVQDALKSYE